jgi:hypothetical protein
MLGREAADRGEWITIADLAVEDGGGDAVAEPQVNWTVVIDHAAMLY